DVPRSTSGWIASGSRDCTKTWKANVDTVVDTSNCHVFGEVDPPDDSTAPLLYKKNGWLVPVNKSTPSGFATSTIPDPPVTVGPEWKNTLIPSPSGAVPSPVFIPCDSRLQRVTPAVNN